MKTKNRKTIFIASAILVFTLTGSFVYQNYLSWSVPPTQEEYLPADLQKSGDSFIASANAGEVKQSKKTNNVNWVSALHKLKIDI